MLEQTIIMSHDTSSCSLRVQYLLYQLINQLLLVCQIGKSVIVADQILIVIFQILLIHATKVSDGGYSCCRE